MNRRKEQDGRHKPNHMNNYSKSKWTVWRNLGNIMLSKRSQIQKDILNNSIYIKDSEKKYVETENRVADV